MRCASKTLTVLYTFFFIMSRSIALSLLRQGNTGEEILQILDVIASDQPDGAEPTLETIEF